MNQELTRKIEKAICENSEIKVNDNLFIDSKTGAYVINGDNKSTSIKFEEGKTILTNHVLSKTLTKVNRTALRTPRSEVSPGDVFVSAGNSGKPYLRFVVSNSADGIECVRPGGGMVIYKDIPINDLMGDEDIFIVKSESLIAEGSVAHQRLQAMLKEEQDKPTTVVIEPDYPGEY